MILKTWKDGMPKRNQPKHILALFKAGYGWGIMSPKFLELKVTYLNLKFIFHVISYHDLVNIVYM